MLAEYLTVPNPGGALPNEGEIAKYLELGASSVDSSVDLISETLAKAIAEIREVRRNLQNAATDGDGRPAQGDVLSTAHTRILNAETDLERFIGPVSMARIRPPLQRLEEMLAANINLPPDWKARAEEWLSEALSGISYFVNVERRRASVA